MGEPAAVFAAFRDERRRVPGCEVAAAPRREAAQGQRLFLMPAARCLSRNSRTISCFRASSALKNWSHFASRASFRDFEWSCAQCAYDAVAPLKTRLKEVRVVAVSILVTASGERMRRLARSQRR